MATEKDKDVTDGQIAEALRSAQVQQQVLGRAINGLSAYLSAKNQVGALEHRIAELKKEHEALVLKNAEAEKQQGKHTEEMQVELAAERARLKEAHDKDAQAIADQIEDDRKRARVVKAASDESIRKCEAQTTAAQEKLAEAEHRARARGEQLDKEIAVKQAKLDKINADLEKVRKAHFAEEAGAS
jgi:chromosome segregation ATPase